MVISTTRHPALIESLKAQRIAENYLDDGALHSAAVNLGIAYTAMGRAANAKNADLGIDDDNPVIYGLGNWTVLPPKSMAFGLWTSIGDVRFGDEPAEGEPDTRAVWTLGLSMQTGNLVLFTDRAHPADPKYRVTLMLKVWPMVEAVANTILPVYPAKDAG